MMSLVISATGEAVMIVDTEVNTNKAIINTVFFITFVFGVIEI